jgi:tyrosine-protein kinase Etk/Wzc
MTKNSKALVDKQASQSIFEQISYKYLPYWPAFLILFLLGGGLSYLYLKVTPKRYESTASILIKDEKKGQEDSKMEEVLNVFNTKKIVENEIEILRSNEVISEVVSNMGLYAPIYSESGWKGAVVRSGYLSSPIRVEHLDPAAIKAAEKIPFTYSNDNKTVTIGSNSYPMDRWTKTPWGTLRFVKNTEQVTSTVNEEDAGNYYFSLVPVYKMADELSTNLVTVSTSKQSTVVELKYKDEVPKRGETILTALINAYNMSTIRKKNEIASNTLKFIDERLKHVSAELDSVEGSIERYRNRAGAVDLSEQSRLYLQSIEENDQKRNQIKIQSSVLDEVEKYVEGKNDVGSIVPSTMNIADPSLNQLIEKLHTDESQYEKLKRTTAENNPIVSGLQNEIAKTRNDIKENIKSQKSNITATQSNLDLVSKKYSSMASTIPQKERELVDVSRARNTKADIYAFLLQKREETAYSMNSTVPDSYIVDSPSTSTTPITPKPLLIGALALLLPLALGIGGISTKDSIRNNILYRGDIEKFTSYPVIGELIHEKFDDPLVTASGNRSFIVEQFRLIRSAIRNFSNPPGAIKSIVVTSSVASEGKSFVACNIANTFARSGKKVVLLELDLHKPKVCETLQMNRGTGITDYMNHLVTEGEIIHTSPNNDNLHVISAGTQSEDASELLLNGRIETLIEYLKTKYDFIVMDTAPINPITDFYALAPLCDLTLYVVRHDVTPKVHIQHLEETMASHNVTKVGIVFNSVKKRGTGKYSYGYGYGYGYDYRSTYESYGGKQKLKKVG